MISRYLMKGLFLNEMGTKVVPRAASFVLWMEGVFLFIKKSWFNDKDGTKEFTRPLVEFGNEVFKVRFMGKKRSPQKHLGILKMESV